MTTNDGLDGKQKALLKASGSGNVAEIKKLISAGVDPNFADANGWNPLTCAARGGHLESVTVLLNAGANPDAEGPGTDTALLQASIGNHHEIARLLHAASTERNPSKCFVATAIYGDCDADEVLLLRKWRDDELIPRTLGRLFVRAYYRIGPALAAVVNRMPIIRPVLKGMLDGFIKRIVLRN